MLHDCYLEAGYATEEITVDLRGEQNDYSLNFVDSGRRPQNFIPEVELTSVEYYPRPRELIHRGKMRQVLNQLRHQCVLQVWSQGTYAFPRIFWHKVWCYPWGSSMGGKCSSRSWYHTRSYIEYYFLKRLWIWKLRFFSTLNYYIIYLQIEYCIFSFYFWEDYLFSWSCIAILIWLNRS